MQYCDKLNEIFFIIIVDVKSQIKNNNIAIVFPNQQYLSHFVDTIQKNTGCIKVEDY